MKVIIPMAGRGTRLRPHTLNIPKPLLKLAGKSIIEWIVDEIKLSTSKPIDEIHYVIGDFGSEVEDQLVSIAHSINAEGYIHYQKEALGTAHAIYCAEEALKGEVFIVFADTIFKGNIQIDNDVDGIIWTMLVDEPEKYGVVTSDENNIITAFVEKPKDNVSSNAIVGLYYFKEAEHLRNEIKFLIDNNLKENNEFQITNCLESLKKKNYNLKCDELVEWLDCGNKSELINTNNRLIELLGKDSFTGSNVNLIDSVITNNCSIGNNVVIQNSVISNCIVYDGATIRDSNIKNSIIGEYSVLENFKGTLFLGDYSECLHD